MVRVSLLTVLLPLSLSLLGYLVHRHLTDPFPVVSQTLHSPAPLSFNSLLHQSAVYHSSLLSGPETIAIHPTDLSLWTGCYDGSVVRVSTKSGFDAQLVSHTGWAAVAGGAAGSDSGRVIVNLTAVCSTSIDPWLCGRPLGLLFRSADELLIADGYHGLLSYEVSSGRWRSLWNDSARDTNSLTLDRSGSVLYFTSASKLFRNHRVLYDFTSRVCSGSVWRYDFDTHTARLLHDELCFANGLLLHQQQLIVAESSTGRILAFDTDDSSGDKQAGTVVIDSDRLPCLPDNLHWDKQSDSYYWVGCGSPIRAAGRFDIYDALGPLPLLRQLIAYLMPYKMIESLIAAQAMLVRIHIVNDSWHEVSDVLIDPDGSHLQSTTSAVWRADDDRLWFTSFRPVRHNQQDYGILSR